jgi:phage recombination protein Bet
MVTREQIKAALEAYTADHAGDFAEALDGDKKFRFMPEGTPSDKDVQIWELNGKLKCSDTGFGLEFMSYLPHDSPQDVLRPVNSPAKANDRKPNAGQMRPVSQAVRDIQVAEMTFDDIRNFLCPAASDKDTFMFLKLCQARNLNPFCGEAYLIPYEDKKSGEIKCSMVVGKEAFMRKAEANPAYRGFKAGIIISRGEELIYREGTLCRKGETLEGGWCEVYRSDRDQPIRSEVSLIEYDKGFGLWGQGKKATMIRKTAVVSGHREAFPGDTSGMYGSEELGIDPDMEVKA